jgi:hypothetical protein
MIWHAMQKRNQNVLFVVATYGLLKEPNVPRMTTSHLGSVKLIFGVYRTSLDLRTSVAGKTETGQNF